MNREILRIALPSIVTNITVPLLGIVDLAIVGHLNNEAAIGAIAVGGLIFNMVYWLFNFLRMGSSGLTAQAYGRRDLVSIRKVLRMGLTVSLLCGIVIFAIQRPMEWLSYFIIAPTEQVWDLALQYFRVRIWAAPAVLALFAMNGWLVGNQNSRYPLYIAVGQNLLNIFASYLLVFHAGLGVKGVALGTVIAEYAGVTTAVCWCRHQMKLSTKLFTKSVDKPSFAGFEQENVDKSKDYELSYQQFFTVNRDIFFRMICLIAVTTAFTAFGARMGDTLLAVNALLMQFFTLFSYFSDGFALAGEALVGKYFGIAQTEGGIGLVRVNEVVRRLFYWGGGVLLLFTLLYILSGKGIIGLLTDDTLVVEAALPYLPWAAAIPLCGMAAFFWDGIYIGATATQEMFRSLLIGTICFFVARYALGHLLADANDALWISFLLYLLIRGAYLTWRWRSVTRNALQAVRG
ncbi:MAG: MATE family efflux transporter [Bacteroidales bacterium]|nr:MATE family efflux transporter [Bacteroidales bacterium]